MSLIDSHPLIEKNLREGIINAITIIENQKQKRNESLKENHQKLIELSSSIDFISLQTKLDKQLTNQGKFLRNYMSLFETFCYSYAQVGDKIGSYTWLVCIIYVDTFSHLIWLIMRD